VSGDGHDGIWSVTAVVDSCLATSGTLRPGVSADDRAHHVNRELPGLTVLAADRVTPDDGSAELDSQDRILVQFSEAVNGIDEESMPVRDLKSRRVGDSRRAPEKHRLRVGRRVRMSDASLTRWRRP
jgi:hypothetical protein